MLSGWKLPSSTGSTPARAAVARRATISTTGEVNDVEVLRSVPLLDEAAVAAVEQWRYEPVPVDGEPVPVVMMVSVNFRLPSP